MVYSCPICVKAVLDTEDGVGCDGSCHRWFHRECVKMSKTDYQRISGNNNTKWYCSRTDCIDTSSQPQNLLLNQLSILTDKISDLSTKVDALVSLPSKVDELIAEVDCISKNLLTLEKRVSDGESRIVNIEKQILNIGKVDGPGGSESIIAEMNDRSRRSRNIVIFNLVESTDKNVEIRKKHDLNLVRNLLEAFNPDVDGKAIKLIRVGKKHNNRMKPLKIIFNNDSDAMRFINKCSLESAIKIDQCFSTIKVSRDRTPQEIKYLNSLRDELKSRTSLGERDLTIKYQNSIPQIVKASKNA